MRATPAIPLFGDAYLADTRHLSLEEHGAYLQLLMIAWRSADCALPDDDRRIAQMLGVTAKKWAKLKPVVMDFWTLENGRWTQARLTKERRFVAKKSEQNADAANARWKRKSLKNNDAEDADASAMQSERNAPPPPITVTNVTGAQAPDRVKMIYDLGVPALVAAGTRETQARSIIGKWRKDAGDDAIVLSCLTECTRLEIGNPVEWMPKAIARRAPKAEPSFLDHLREKHALDAKLAAGGAR